MTRTPARRFPSWPPHKGRAYQLQRSNQYNARWDVAVESMEEPWLQLERLAGNRFGNVRFEGFICAARSPISSATGRWLA